MKFIANSLLILLMVGCTSKVPINGKYDATHDMDYARKVIPDLSQRTIDSEFTFHSRYWNKHYDLNPTYEAEIDYPRFTHIVIFSDPEKEPYREDWILDQVDETRYELIFNAYGVKDIVTLVYDLEEESLWSAGIKYKKR